MNDETNVVEIQKPARQRRKKPAIVRVHFSEGTSTAFELKDHKDWGVMYDYSVLNINDKEGVSHYYVIGNLIKWEIDELDD